MDSTKKYENPSPRLDAGRFNKLFFCWLVPFFRYGRKNEVEPKNIHNVLPRDRSETLGNQLERNWSKEVISAEKGKRKPRFQRAVLKTYGLEYMKLGLYTLFLALVVKTLQPVALGLLIGHFSPNATSTTNEAVAYATGVVLLTFLESVIFCHVTYQCRELGMQLRVSASSLIYRKAMRLSCGSAMIAKNGLMINLLSNDVVRFENFFIFCHYLWVTPLQMLVIGYLIWRSVGVAAFPGVLFMVLQTIPFQVYFGKVIHGLRGKVAVRTDKRVLLMNEIINGIRVIKMYTWEPVFQQLVYFARRNELKVIAIANYLKGVTWASLAYAQRAALFVTILVYTLQDNVVTAEKVFMVSQFYIGLQVSMAVLFPRGLHFYAEAKVSLNRVQNFLLLREIGASKKSPMKNEPNTSVSVEKVNASWLDNAIVNTLYDINVVIPNKSLYAVVGSVGAGKSSFLKLILGELRPSQGQVTVGTRLSYASQEPWLFAGSVRNNILFGEPYAEDKYNRVARACCLLEDFEQLPHGDRTLVGDKGSSLSGGQCARVSLARAVYRDADVYLLDDPLSAVDTRVGKRLFQDCINGYLKDKTRVLVTHQVQFLKEADAIVFLEKGKVEFQGSFEDFKSHGECFQHLEKDESPEKTLVEDVARKEDDEGPLEMAIPSEEDNQEEPREVQELVAKGNVSTSLYWKYFKANGSHCLLLVFLISYVIAQVICSGSDYWIAYWIRKEETRMSSYAMKENDNSNGTSWVTEPDPGIDKDFALYVYGILVFGSVVMATGKNILFLKICKNASFNIHNLMINCVLKAPMRFFDANSSGRILNRFSKDLGAVDEILSMAMLESLQILSTTIGIAVQILIINWWLIFPMIVVMMALLYIRNVYLATAQKIKRLEGNAKSPVLSHANSSLSGLLTIRSCRAEAMVCKEFDSFQDGHTSTYALVLSTMTAFGFWIDLVSVTFVTIVTFSFIFYDNQSISGSRVGLAITQVLAVTGLLQHGMKMAAEMVTQMIGVERLFQFTKLEQEGPFESEPGKEPSKEWPDKGEVVFDHLYLRYADTVEPVLKNLHFSVEPGMKVGVVGRTGAGKSSLISALFHLAKVEGKLYIDEVDTNRIGLRELRSKLSIIPQEPMLFSASLRDNLDPFHEFDDAELWLALENVELNKAFSSLDQLVEQGGSNLSAGQRQLLCLARAAVKKRKILVLDEATANVDPATDALIQKTIRINFKNCTVLTIAHRLNTIMDSDKVLVMNYGEAVEFDHPHLLLQKNNGYFVKMVQQTGNTMASHLKNVAEKAFKKQNIDSGSGNYSQ
ncbi:multidrug resistance-associated protein 4-like [Copidosoma floridanum]|uniref:multidrug resistance-associated protein 4-like n=1 Tax=Copidosoma floridanum TaxID=29053 RepID=UPI0006C98FB9|nr:multidrug resistance-associated protein 4-like [Copidosoma floridanum]